MDSLRVYPVHLKYRPKGSRAWLTATWDQVAPDLVAARRIVFDLLALNRCEWARLEIDY